jgi:dipeptidyl aminopeptidase/acylaminoacyl peptidase
MRHKANGQGFIPGLREARVWRPAQIWVQKLDGSPKRQLDTTAYSRRSASVSPDGKWVAFVADPALRPDSVVEAERDSLARLPYDAKRMRHSATRPTCSSLRSPAGSRVG